MDGKWHPEWEEPEEGAKNNIADISYLTDDRAYSMPDLGDRPEDVRISDGWTQTMPDGDHAVQVDFLLQEIQARKVAFDHMCNAVKKQKVVVDSDMHVMLMSMSAMNKRLKAVFKQVDDGEEYNAAIDRQFSMDYEVADVIIDNEPEAFEGSDGEEQTEVASGPSNATGSASTIIPTPANGSNRRRMLPRLAASSGAASSGATSSRSTSSGATSTHDARGREKKRLLLEKTIDEDPRPLESLKSNETVDLTGEKGNSPTHVFGSPSIEATFAEL